MQQRTPERLGWTIVSLCMGIAAAALIGAAGCQRPQTAQKSPPHVAGQPDPDQQAFASDDEAAKGLLDALKAGNRDEVGHIFGTAAHEEMLSGDKVQDEKRFAGMAKHAGEQLRVEKVSDAKCILHIGEKDWPFPIPLVKAPTGKWFFDTQAGKQEILARRIGANELATIKVCRAFVAAQREYASKDRDGSGVLQYAQHYRSTPGKRDGLYWEATPGEEESPAGPMVAEAALKGYSARKSTEGRRPYQGYFLHILTRQGSAAPGGRYNYVINGRMIAGFALVASPAKYGVSGIMTLIISHHGKLYEKDLGPNTAELVRKMTEYNPDSTWCLVAD